MNFIIKSAFHKGGSPSTSTTCLSAFTTIFRVTIHNKSALQSQQQQHQKGQKHRPINASIQRVQERERERT